MFELILAAQLVATGYMVGLIWFVQIVHYPMFADVASSGDFEHFKAYESRHQARTTFAVLPPMLIELATATLLVLPAIRPTTEDQWIWGVGLAMLAVIWLSTFFVQVPLHRKLGQGFDAKAHRWLVRSNWIRTVLWSLRLLLVVSVLIELS